VLKTFAHAYSWAVLTDLYSLWYYKTPNNDVKKVVGRKGGRGWSLLKIHSVFMNNNKFCLLLRLQPIYHMNTNVSFGEVSIRENHYNDVQY